ncbi:unnamed protein product [Ceratitis capitata]|uniref:(Mediterranean fruit fly) hypothetical protein n=2 Tax=Ceratitis capitata TaxID=7213 RepID=A0A811VBT0_CERCA|nr:unnamed protein product [Ceratitis capitata]
MLLYAEMKPLCGGSIITDRYILTAAHCIKPELQRVRLGEHRISTIRDCVSGVCQSFEEFGIDPYQKPQVHPNYRSLANYKDIALIKLDRTIDFAAHRHIKPVCLPIPPMISPVLPSDDLILAGWGLKENDLPVDILQKGIMKLEELNRCETLYSLYKVDDSRLCIQAGANNSVSCRGDSGAPLFWKSEYISNNYILQRYTQIGLVSLGYGKECGSLTSEPFMYENVTDSLQWITNAILN